MATRPENLGSSGKRIRGPNLYINLLPLLPSPPSFFSSFLSSIPHLSLNPTQIQAVYDELTGMIRVHDEEDMTLLWRRGFFGKGSLSRSEPSWRRRVENKIAQAEGREQRLTAEEITAQRRVERNANKLVKKLEREADKLAAATASSVISASERGSNVGSPKFTSPLSIEIDQEEEEDEEVERAGEADELEGILEGEEDPEDEVEEEETTEPVLPAPPPSWHLTAEYTQLQPEEAFFLLFALGTLDLKIVKQLMINPDLNARKLTIQQTWNLLLLQSNILPSSSVSSSLDFESASLSSIPPSISDPRLTRFDSPFLVQYASYHHFRSMGWVVRSGVKFCADWVLYGQGGPVGGHAEFAVVVIPNYVDPQDFKSSPFKSSPLSSLLAEGECKQSWRWFNTVNRVCSGVKKTLVLLQVLIPPQSSLPSPNFIAENPGKALGMLQMREVTVRRFMAGRMRD